MAQVDLNGKLSHEEKKALLVKRQGTPNEHLTNSPTLLELFEAPMNGI